MRKIIAGLFMSLDGVYEGPGPADQFEYAGWTMPYFNDEVGGYIGSRMATADALLLGRKTYEGFAGFFAPQTGGTADAMNNLQKYVVSNTLTSADWQNSTLINGNVVEEITRIKQLPGQDISVSGSGTLLQTLIAHNLVDEFSLLVYPIVLGTGKQVFQHGLPKHNLKVIEIRPFSNGVVLMRYQPETTA
jgi:dihydrofolate reductase